jgi:hypothetical protein
MKLDEFKKLITSKLAGLGARVGFSNRPNELNAYIKIDEFEIRITSYLPNDLIPDIQYRYIDRGFYFYPYDTRYLSHSRNLDGLIEEIPTRMESIRKDIFNLIRFDTNFHSYARTRLFESQEEFLRTFRLLGSLALEIVHGDLILQAREFDIEQEIVQALKNMRAAKKLL